MPRLIGRNVFHRGIKPLLQFQNSTRSHSQLHNPAIPTRWRSQPHPSRKQVLRRAMRSERHSLRHKAAPTVPSRVFTQSDERVDASA